MRILLTNDDGYHAPGLKVLEDIAAELSDDVWVVAPAEEQSGAGHSLTLTVPVRLRRHGEKRFSVLGTPTDSVMMALGHVMKDNPPDIVLSGVNRGANLAEDVTYSGTVSAAMEGTLYGIRSIALSQAMTQLRSQSVFRTAAAWGARVLRPLIEMEWEPGTLLNVNFPPVEPDDVQGVKVCEQGFRDYGETAIEQRQDTRGVDYFWFGLGRESPQPGHETDLTAMRRGEISVTPLHLDMTHYDTMYRLRDALSDIS
ncbi:5'/3'-nucleotidase SurE [Pacificimonas sp. WHA3]|uniref:5'-nucleotidase SurE n=1 Tax=Pacificimonas pallii TaxID=2827236 RepID=A0ABS6SCJ3_9SPHN|nr:5'/3'-nucleotidase SurE [Pacificimonas pallii]MBV7256075.1 5'/3'-nucleotidase SurE [Pacificimonas pallii]